MRIFNKLWVLFLGLAWAFQAWAINPELEMVELYRADKDRFTYLSWAETGIALGRPASPWQTTGRTFFVYGQEMIGSVPASRFYYLSGTEDGHLFVLGDEAAVIKANWSAVWTEESANYFWVDKPAGTSCPLGIPLYRIYNNSRGGAPNHRFTTDLDEYNRLGPEWGVGEGIRMCIVRAGQPPSGGGPGAPPKLAGKIDIQAEKQMVSFNGVSGELDGLCDATGCKVSAAQVKEVCFNSNATGWTTNPSGSRACAPIAGDMTATLPKTCNNAQGNWSARLVDGTLRWFAPELWERTGIQSRVATVLDQSGKEAKVIEYGKNWYQPPLVTATKGADGKAEVILDFGSNCLGGFGGPLEREEKLMFLWNSDKAGGDGKPGWGYGTPYPSTHQGFKYWDKEDEAFFVSIQGITCSDAGNITVYRWVSGDGASTVWDPGVNGFGYAWFGIPQAGIGNPFWTKGTGVDWDQAKSLIKVSVPGC